MNYNFHAHTYRCHHATGTPEEYVIRAIDGGIEYMGFSDHFPLVLSDGRQSQWRMKESDAEGYVAEILGLKEKYAAQIRIYCGFEMEYYPEQFDRMVDSAIRYGAEYLICGEHFCSAEDSGERPSSAPTDDPGEMQKYADRCVEAIKTGAFTYIAHPDLKNFVGDRALYEREAGRICEASLKYSVPLEINFLGIREHRIYPRERFWRIAGEIGAPVTFGMDAHSVTAACDTESVARAMELACKYSLNYIGMPKIVDIRKRS